MFICLWIQGIVLGTTTANELEPSGPRVYTLKWIVSKGQKGRTENRELKLYVNETYSESVDKSLWFLAQSDWVNPWVKKENCFFSPGRGSSSREGARPCSELKKRTWLSLEEVRICEKLVEVGWVFVSRFGARSGKYSKNSAMEWARDQQYATGPVRPL